MKQSTVIAIIAVVIVLGLIAFFVMDKDGVLMGDDQTTETDATNNIDNTTTGNANVSTGVNGNDNDPTSSNSVVLQETETGNFITVAQATLESDGYVVIYQVDSNGNTDVIGHTDLLEAGSYTNIQLQIDTVVSEDQTIVAVLHADDGDGEFEFPESDFYLENANSTIVSDVDVVDVRQEDEAAALQAQVDAYLEEDAQ